MPPSALLAAGLIALGGCLAAPASSPSGPDAAPLPWDLRDCFFAYGLATVPAAAMQARVPPGFQVRGTVPFGVGPPPPPPVPPVTTFLGFEVDVCASGLGLHGPVEGMQYAHFWTPATPPPEIALEGHVGFAAFDFLVPGADRRAVFQEAGLPAHDGHIEVSAVAPGIPLRAFDIAYEFDGLGAFRLTVAEDPRGAAQGNGTIAHYVAASDGGLSRWRYDWRTLENRPGLGTIEVPEGSSQAEVLGATSVPVKAFFGRWDYTEGLIELRV